MEKIISGADKVASSKSISGSKKRRSALATKAGAEQYGSFQVKTKGFTEQYSTLSVAKRNFDSIKRKKIKEEETFKVTLSGKTKTGNWVELDYCQIDDSYYN